MDKGTYHAITMQDVNTAALRDHFAGQPLVLATDVGKHAMYTALADPLGQIARILSWEQPREFAQFVRLVDALAPSETILVLEPSGTYGDPLRAFGLQQGWTVHRVSPKRVHDAAEVFDGVPSLHDAKAAWLLVKFYTEGLSHAWEARSPAQRALEARVKALDRLVGLKQAHLNRLEAELARYWPEVTAWIAKDTATLLALLQQYGGPAEVASHPQAARSLMQRVSRGRLSDRTQAGILASARTTCGQAMLPAEAAMVAALAEELVWLRQRLRERERHVEAAMTPFADAVAIGQVVGTVTAAVLRARLGDVRAYASPHVLVKQCGLNLKERSSGTHQGRLMITKRGPAQVRRYLWWATLRLIRTEPIFRAWHQKKVARDGGSGGKSVVALMRKLVTGLWHVAWGQPFDATQLFDGSRLQVPPQTA